MNTQDQNMLKVILFAIPLGEEKRDCVERSGELWPEQGKRSVINTVQTNCTPYGVPSRFPHSQTGNMQYARH